MSLYLYLEALWQEIVLAGHNRKKIKYLVGVELN